MTRDGRPWARGLGALPSGPLPLPSAWADEDPHQASHQDAFRLLGGVAAPGVPEAGPSGLQSLHPPPLLPSPSLVTPQLQQLQLFQQQQQYLYRQLSLQPGPFQQHPEGASEAAEAQAQAPQGPLQQPGHPHLPVLRQSQSQQPLAGPSGLLQAPTPLTLGQALGAEPWRERWQPLPGQGGATLGSITQGGMTQGVISQGAMAQGGITQVPAPVPLGLGGGAEPGRERWAVEVGKDMPRLLDYVLREPQVLSGHVSLYLIFVMCDVPCAMGIAFRVSEMEARVADIHEKHIFKTVLSPLVNEIRRKRRRVQVQGHVEREDKVDTGLCEAAKRLRISRLVITSRRTTCMRKKKASSDGLSETYIRQLKDMDCAVVVLQAGKRPRVAEPTSALLNSSTPAGTAPGTPTSTTATASSPSAHPGRPAGVHGVHGVPRSSTVHPTGHVAPARPQSSGSWRSSSSASPTNWAPSGGPLQGQGGSGDQALAYPQAHSYHGGTSLQRQAQQHLQADQAARLAQGQGAQQRPQANYHLHQGPGQGHGQAQQQQQQLGQGQGLGLQLHPQLQALLQGHREGARPLVSPAHATDGWAGSGGSGGQHYQQSLPGSLPGRAGGQTRRKQLWMSSSSPQLALALARTGSDVTAASAACGGLSPPQPRARTSRSRSDSHLLGGGRLAISLGLGRGLGVGAGRRGDDDIEGMGSQGSLRGGSGSSGGASSPEEANSEEGALRALSQGGIRELPGPARGSRVEGGSGGGTGAVGGGWSGGQGRRGAGPEGPPLEGLVHELRRLQARLVAAHQEEEALRRAVDDAQDEVKSANSQKEEESLRLVACEAELGIAKFQFQEASRTVAMLKTEVDLARRAAAEALEVAERAKREMEMAQQRQHQQQQQQGAGGGRGGGALEGPSGGASLQPSDFREYTFQELSQAAGGWKRLLRNGDSGMVYHGLIEGHQPVAIRVLKNPSAPGALEEFDREVKMGRGLRHPNLMLLMGCCQDPPCLVYEFMAQGSLYDRLVCRGGSRPLHWATRFDIFCDVCAALMHLHCRENPIVHFDLKPSNVFLDKKFVAKLGDVGLARVMRRLSDDTVSVPLGTWGYACPELLRSNLFCSRTDVYSLGMVLYDLLGGDSSTRTQGLVQAMEQAVSDCDLKRIGQLTDPAARWPPELAMELAAMARDCTGARRRDRPEVAKDILPGLERLRPMVEGLVRREASEKRRGGRLRLGALGALAGGFVAALSPAPSQEDEDSRAEACVPSGFKCPITLELMEHPVMAADGHTYEEAAIQQWLGENETSPVTNAPLPHKHLIANYNLRSLIQDWKDRRLLHRPSMGHLNFSSRSSSFSSQRSVVRWVEGGVGVAKGGGGGLPRSRGRPRLWAGPLLLLLHLRRTTRMRMYMRSRKRPAAVAMLRVLSPCPRWFKVSHQLPNGPSYVFICNSIFVPSWKAHLHPVAAEVSGRSYPWW